MKYMNYDERTCREFLRSYDKPKKRKKTLQELSDNFDLQERIRLRQGYRPRDKKETLAQWQMN